MMTSSASSTTVRASRLAAAAGLAAGLFACSAHAQTLTWNNVAGGSASTASNWNPAQSPSSGSDLLFNLNNTFTVTFNAASNLTNSHTYRRGNVSLSITSPHEIRELLEIGSITGDDAIVTLLSGTLDISDTFATGVILADQASTTGLLTLTAASSILNTSTKPITIGNNGAGSLVIQAGADAACGSLRLGFGSGSGQLTITGGTGAFPNINISNLNASSLTHKAGQIDLLAGGLLDVSGSANLGATAAAAAHLNVSGFHNIVPSRFHVAGNLDVARNATAAAAGSSILTVGLNGAPAGTVQIDGLASFGDPHGGSGTLRLDGGTFVSNGGLVFDPATGFLDFQDGVLQLSGGPFTPPPAFTSIQGGTAAGDLAELRVASDYDLAFPSSMFVGSTRAGRLTITGTGSTATAPNGVLGNSSGGSGELLIQSGGAFTGGAFLTVGGSGSGTLTIQANSSASFAELALGASASGSGTATISGANASLSVTNAYIGGNIAAAPGGAGALTIEAGATVNASGEVIVFSGDSLTIDSASLSAGSLSTNGSANIILTGGTVNGPLTLNALGSLQVPGPLSVSVNGPVSLTSTSASISVLSSSFLGSDSSTLGFQSSGTLNISSLGNVLLRDADFAKPGIVNLSGDAVLNSSNGIAISPTDSISGQGALNGLIQMNGGTLAPTAAGFTIAGTLANTLNSGINGTKLDFSNSGSYIGSGTVTADIDGDPGSSIIATGNLTIGRNTTSGWNFGGFLNVGSHSVTLVDANGAVLGGGTSLVGGSLACSAGIGNQNGAAIFGRGTLNANVVNAGRLAPEGAIVANSSQLVINGNLTCNPSSILDFEIGDEPGASPLNDRISVSGAATFGGQVKVRLRPGLRPRPGDQYILCNAQGGRTGTFTAFDLPPVPCPPEWRPFIVYSGTAAILLFVSDCTRADFNCDGSIDPDDLGDFINCFFSAPPCPGADYLNADGNIDPDDLGDFINLYFSCNG